MLYGVKLRVVGEEHLRAPRPAVPVFRHVDGFDPMVVNVGSTRLHRSSEARTSPIMRLDAMMVCTRSVDVAVRPPVATDEWAIRELPKRVDELRELFVKISANWRVNVATLVA
jgi:hypothetical protein